MIRIGLTLVVLIISLHPYGQSDNLDLAASGENLNEIIPEGWKVLSSSKGDLNNDGIEDVAFAIQGVDTRNFNIDEDHREDTLDLNPRILAIYFGDVNGNLSNGNSTDYIFEYKEGKRTIEKYSRDFIE